MVDHSNKEPLRVVVRSQRGLLAAVVFGIAALGGIPLAIFIFGTTFEYSVGPQDIAEEITAEKRTGTAFGFLNRFIIYSDEAKYEFSHPGYRNELVTFSTETSQRRFHIELRPLPGYLTIAVTDEFPIIARINGIEQPTLRSIELTQGSYVVSISREDLELTTATVDIEGYGVEQQIEFDLSAFRATLRVQTIPSTATINLDDETIGIGRYEGGVAAGAFQLEVLQHGYESKTVDLQIDSQKDYDLGTIKLIPKPIAVNVQSNPSSASILLDGNYVGEADVSFTVSPTRSYEMVVRKPGYREHREILTPQIATNIQRKIDFEQKTVRVSIQIEPAGDVFVNGIRIDAAPHTVDLYPGDTVEARQSGYASQSETVDPKAGEVQQFHFKLREPLDHAFHTAPQIARVAGNLELIRFPQLKFVKKTDLSQPNTMTVELTRPFYLGATEVTVEAYKLYSPSTKGGSPKQPITDLTWHNAALFCNWLSKQQGLKPFYLFNRNGFVASYDRTSLGFRLPTEAEWEAGIGFDWENNRVYEPYEWGAQANVPLAFANLAGSEMEVQRLTSLENFEDNHKELAPVKSYRSNFNGLYDMSGNAAEWVHDHYEITRVYDGGPDYMGPRTGFAHTIKGASFRTTSLAELAINFRTFSANQKPEVGFRVARWIY